MFQKDLKHLLMKRGWGEGKGGGQAMWSVYFLFVSIEIVLINAA